MLDIVALLPLAYLAVIAIPLIIVDVREHRLPNKMVLPFIALSFITTIVVSLVVLPLLYLWLMGSGLVC